MAGWPGARLQLRGGGGRGEDGGTAALHLVGTTCSLPSLHLVVRGSASCGDVRLLPVVVMVDAGGGSLLGAWFGVVGRLSVVGGLVGSGGGSVRWFAPGESLALISVSAGGAGVF